MNNTLNIALPKGRLGEGVYDIFESLGYGHVMRSHLILPFGSKASSLSDRLHDLK